MDLCDHTLRIQHMLKHRLNNHSIEALIDEGKSVCIANYLCSRADVNVRLDDLKFGSLDESLHTVADYAPADDQHPCIWATCGYQIAESVKPLPGLDGSGRRRYAALGKVPQSTAHALGGCIQRGREHTVSIEEVVVGIKKDWNALHDVVLAALNGDEASFARPGQ